MFTRYDRNRDGKLDAAEMARSRFLDLKPADRSGDGQVTKDELTAWMTARAQGGAAAAPTAAAKPAAPPASATAPASVQANAAAASSKPAANSLASAAADSEPSGPQRKSYRFLSATERLPSGLPSWFREKDRDRDGQVMMSEWTSRWNDAAVSEFSRHDRNGDGVITPAEALRSGG
jgi:hypothetical protein